MTVLLLIIPEPKKTDMKTKLQVLATALIFFSIAMVSCKKESSIQTPVATEEEALVASRRSRV